MRGKAKLSLAVENLRRNRRGSLMSSVGIIVGISALVFFIGLSEGIKEVVLGRVFLIDQVEVIPKRIQLGGFELDGLFGASSADRFTTALTKELEGIEGLSGVYPKMKFTFPASARGGRRFLGKNLQVELIADGIDPGLVKDELATPESFRDFLEEESCSAEATCSDGHRCDAGRCVPIDCSEEASVCTGESYCALQEPQAAGRGGARGGRRQCELPIPVLLNPQLLELYNGGLSVALGGGRRMPKISPGLIVGFHFQGVLGRSVISRGGKGMSRRLKIVGFSDKAIGIGVTLPLAYVKRFNRTLTSKAAGERYHSIILKIEDQRRFPEIVAAVKERGFELADKTANAEQAAKILKTIEAVFALVSLIIVGIAALNISQMFYMLITQRRRELGLLRALGASRGDLRQLILLEAALIGLFAGAMGLLVGSGAGALTDWIAGQLPRFPYKPETFFIYPFWLWSAAVIAAIFFCVIGAFWPANRAAQQEPAEALTQ